MQHVVYPEGVVVVDHSPLCFGHRFSPIIAVYAYVVGPAAGDYVLACALSHSPISASASRALCTLPQARRKPCTIPWITSVWTGTPAAANFAAIASPSERRTSISGNTRTTG